MKIWVLILTILSCSILVSIKGDDRSLKGHLFPHYTVIDHRVVTCTPPVTMDTRFPADTWSCYDLRVDGMRLRNVEGAGSMACGSGMPIKNDLNDLPQLCRHLLAAHFINRELWSTYVSGVSCSASPQGRVIFVPHNGTFVWEKLPDGYGYLKTLHCMGME